MSDELREICLGGPLWSDRTRVSTGAGTGAGTGTGAGAGAGAGAGVVGHLLS